MQPHTQRFQDLLIYQLAFQASVEVFASAQAFADAPEAPDLIRRLLAQSRKVRAHIARAWGKRQDQVALVGELCAAQDAASEVQRWIEATVLEGYLSADAGQTLYDHYRAIHTGLDQLMETASTALVVDPDLPATA